MKKWLVLALVSLCSSCLAERHSQLCLHRLLPRLLLGQKIWPMPTWIITRLVGRRCYNAAKDMGWLDSIALLNPPASEKVRLVIQIQNLFRCWSLTILKPVIVFICVFPSPIFLDWAFLHWYNYTDRAVSVKGSYLENLLIYMQSSSYFRPWSGNWQTNRTVWAGTVHLHQCWHTGNCSGVSLTV